MARAAGRWLVAQVAALHSPEDVQVCVLTDASGQAAWEWARWLPHCRPAEGQNCAALIGNDAETVAARIAELQAIIAARQQAPREQARAGSPGHRGGLRRVPQAPVAARRHPGAARGT